MSDFLSDMVAGSRDRARALVPRRSELMSSAQAARPPVDLDLTTPDFDILAEIKLRSPAEGQLKPGAIDIGELASSYEAAGAAAISVLTEPDRFHGQLSHLKAASSSVATPVMRKDFLVDPLQIYEARAAGASGVLLIAKILTPSDLKAMVDQARQLGMFALVEIFDESDLDVASVVFDSDILIGVNCRDLTTLEVRFGRFEVLVHQLPSHLPKVAESGITTPEHASRVASLGYRMALVGTALMRAVEPGGTLREMMTAGRTAALGVRA